MKAIAATLTAVALVSCAAPEKASAPAAASSTATSGDCGAGRLAAREDIVVDAATHRTWRRCPMGQSWRAAGSRCEGAIYATEAYETVKRAVASEVRNSGKPWRLPTIDEVSAIAGGSCGPRFRALFSEFSAPIWTGSSLGDGRVYQYDPQARRRTIEKAHDAPGIVLLVRD